VEKKVFCVLCAAIPQRASFLHSSGSARVVHFLDPLPRLWQTRGVDGRKAFRGIVSIRLPCENLAMGKRKETRICFWKPRAHAPDLVAACGSFLLSVDDFGGRIYYYF
jgi:hypothetical protein